MKTKARRKPDTAATGWDRHPDRLPCNVCGRPIPPRSWKAGAAVCPRCKHKREKVGFVVYRSEERYPTPVERREIQTAADEALAQALAASFSDERPPSPSPEELIEEARQTGALNIVIARIEDQVQRSGETVNPEEIERRSGLRG